MTRLNVMKKGINLKLQDGFKAYNLDQIIVDKLHENKPVTTEDLPNYNHG